MRTCFLAQRWLLSCCVLACWREQGSSLGLFIGTRIPFKRTLLPGLNQLPKAPPSKTITLGNRISILRDKNIWSITLHHITTYCLLITKDNLGKTQTMGVSELYAPFSPNTVLSAPWSPKSLYSRQRGREGSPFPLSHCLS